MTPPTILPLHTTQADLDNVGGKGANLSRLARSGFPVPGGFLVTTQAYRTYVAANDLEARTIERATSIQPDDPGALKAASTEIRVWFSSGEIPSELTEALRQAYADIGRPPVAVRSSATAEDLPEMSFAGQQDTFLNIINEEALLEAVVDCWSSLWTARAIGYRARNAIPHEGVALAVVVQEMVPAEASGVLFTANPLSGLRGEAVIDATLGLGEALVGGHVEPDHYVVDTATGRITSKTLGAKAIAIRGQAGGGVSTIEDKDAAGHQALPDAQILELARLGQRVAAEYDFPQDIEWAWADGQLALLQARPITALFPIPEGMGPDPLQMLLSFALIQGIFDPITPLGQDAIRLLFAGGASLFGFQLTHQTQGLIVIAGERLWVNASTALCNPIGRQILPRFFSLVDPSTVSTLKLLLDEPGLGSREGRLRVSTVRRLARFALPTFKRILGYWREPQGQAERIQAASERQIASLRAKSQPSGNEKITIQQRVALYKELYHAFPYAVPYIFSAAFAGLIPLALLNKIASHLTGSGDLALEITRGMPHNVTTQMDLALWETAQAIRADGAAFQAMLAENAGDLSAAYLRGELPETAQKAIGGFLVRYGMRGIGEIDIGRARWQEDPIHIIKVLQSYLQIEDPSLAPDVVFQRGAQTAEAAIKTLEAAARKTFGGPLKARFIRWAAVRLRALAGLRESPKFFIIQMMNIIRQGLLESGAELVAAGVLEQPDDLFFLYLSELEAFANGERGDWAALIAARRADFARETRRGQIPRLLLSDGRTFYAGLTAPEGAGDILRGSPVSPGVVEGLVRVMLDPHESSLAPGEILVCPGTDPAWTPLFLAAGGLVMEVGGMITHGAIVAREYGIPAVVCVDRATTRLRTGQRIQVDGSTGVIVLLE